MRREAAAAILLVAVAVACRREPADSAPAEPADPLAEARQLLEERRYDEAIARIGENSDAESLHLLGRAWLGKAETAPVPVPAGLKPEELRALALLERAVAVRPDHAGAQLALANLLAPYALERLRAGRRGAVGPQAPGPDASPERVMRAYEAAVQLDPAGRAPVEGLVGFARASGMLAEAEAGFRELLRRDRENPDALVRFGDFLATEKRDLDGAVAQYTQALIWRPNDAATKEKIADIYLSLAAGHLGRREYAHAQARIADARRYVADPASAVAATLRELETRLAEIRGGPLPR